MVRKLHNLMFTQGEAAALIGVNKSTFTRWDDVPYTQEKNKKMYYGPELLKHEQVTNILVERNKDAEKKSEMDIAKINLLKAQAKKTLLETKQKNLDFKLKKKELIDARDVEIILAKIIMSARAKWRGIGRKIATEVIGMKDDQQIQTIVDNFIDDGLKELSVDNAET